MSNGFWSSKEGAVLLRAGSRAKSSLGYLALFVMGVLLITGLSGCASIQGSSGQTNSSPASTMQDKRTAASGDEQAALNDEGEPVQ